jgi:hypothetical protein
MHFAESRFFDDFTSSLLWTRILSMSTRRKDNASENVRYRVGGYASSTAAMPSSLVMHDEWMMDLLTRWIESRDNKTLVLNLPHPVVVTRCLTEDKANIDSPDFVVRYVQQDGLRQGVLSSVGDLLNDYMARNSSQEAAMGGSLASEWSPSWYPSPEVDSSALVGVFPVWGLDGYSSSCDANYSPLSAPQNISVMFADAYRKSTASCFGFTTCSISAFWARSRTEISVAAGSSVAQTQSFPDAGFTTVSYGNPITIDPKNVPSFSNPKITQSLYNTLNNDGAVEPHVAAMFVTAIDNVSKQSATLYTARGNPPENATEWITDVEVLLHGFGYDISSTSVRLSLAVMTTYCIITIVYILYILITGHTSTAWNSAIELVMLALQSKRPEHLGHTSVGIESMETLRQGVGIRVNGDEELELVFPHDNGFQENNFRKIEPNCAY